jgi:ureidoglycolate lyase
VKLQAAPLTPDAFAPFGTVLSEPARGADASGPGWTWWADLERLPGDPRGYGFGYLALRPGPRSFDWAERHMRSHELIAPLGADCLVYAGPADHADDPQRMPALSDFRAFRVAAGQAVLLAPGVWHGAPFAADDPGAALVVLPVGTGSEDTVVRRFEETPVEITGGGT